ncbi:MAG: hypothetical protein QGH07_10505 [Alphaproteobacteria bacterium]|jgi:hypothetical protein|nr:hypothetical protein [Alphaproteobacteria bacterium]
MTTTVVRHDDWVVAWNTGSQSHTYLRDTDVSFDEQEILSVGDRYEGCHLAFEQDFQSGAGCFVGGKGRHGAF